MTRQEEDERETQGERIAARQAGTRQRHLDAAERLQHAREMGAPERFGEGVALADRKRVLECRKGTMLERVVALDAPLGGGDARQAEGLDEPEEGGRERREEAQEEEEMEPRRQEKEKAEEGEGGEEAGRAEGRPERGPERFPEEREPRALERAPLESLAPRKRLAHQAAPRAQPLARSSSQSGRRSRRRSSSYSSRGRTTA